MLSTKDLVSIWLHTQLTLLPISLEFHRLSPMVTTNLLFKSMSLFLFCYICLFFFLYPHMSEIIWFFVFLHLTYFTSSNHVVSFCFNVKNQVQEAWVIWRWSSSSRRSLAHGEKQVSTGKVREAADLRNGGSRSWWMSGQGWVLKSGKGGWQRLYHWVSTSIGQ